MAISDYDAVGYVLEGFKSVLPVTANKSSATWPLPEQFGSLGRETVDGYFGAAVRRGTIVNENGQYTLVARRGSYYPRDHVVERMFSPMNTGWIEHD
jgi:hypothetical protein